MPEHESASCSACAAVLGVDYKASDDALRLWSEVNSGLDKFKALDEIRVLAGCFFAAWLYADAFDLYYLVWNQSELSMEPALDGLAAAIDCARASATPTQGSCVEAILHHCSSAYQKTPFQLHENLLHSFLGDLHGRCRWNTVRGNLDIRNTSGGKMYSGVTTDTLLSTIPLLDTGSSGRRSLEEYPLCWTGWVNGNHRTCQIFWKFGEQRATSLRIPTRTSAP